MRVEATSNYLYTSPLRASERAREITANAAQAASAPQAVEDAPRAESSKPVDFTHMTQKELIDWANEQYFSGNITIEELGVIGVMSIFGTPLDAPESDLPYCDYMQIAGEGLYFARLRNDGSQKFWDKALSIMERYQEQGAGVDTFA